MRWQGDAGETLIHARSALPSVHGLAETGLTEMPEQSRSAIYRPEIPLPARVAPPGHCCRGEPGESHPPLFLSSLDAAPSFPGKIILNSPFEPLLKQPSPQLICPERQLMSFTSFFWHKWQDDGWWKNTLLQIHLTVENKEKYKLEWTKSLSYGKGKKNSLNSKTSNSSFSLPEYLRRIIYTRAFCSLNKLIIAAT